MDSLPRSALVPQVGPELLWEVTGQAVPRLLPGHGLKSKQLRGRIQSVGCLRAGPVSCRSTSIMCPPTPPPIGWRHPALGRWKIPGMCLVRFSLGKVTTTKGTFGVWLRIGDTQELQGGWEERRGLFMNLEGLSHTKRHVK